MTSQYTEAEIQESIAKLDASPDPIELLLRKTTFNPPEYKQHYTTLGHGLIEKFGRTQGIIKFLEIFKEFKDNGQLTFRD